MDHLLYDAMRSAKLAKPRLRDCVLHPVSMHCLTNLNALLAPDTLYESVPRGPSIWVTPAIATRGAGAAQIVCPLDYLSRVRSSLEDKHPVPVLMLQRDISPEARDAFLFQHLLSLLPECPNRHRKSFYRVIRNLGLSLGYQERTLTKSYIAGQLGIDRRYL